MPKETYFTPETIQRKSADMLAALASFRRRHENISFEPSRAALLVLDMQDYFLQEDSHAFIPSGLAIIPNIQSLISTFCANNRPVIFTRYVNTKEDAGMMGKWWKDVITEDSPKSGIAREFDLTGSIVINKSQYDAFWKTSLDETLHSMNVNQLVITGVMTHLCCETTARSAFMRGYEVFFAVDGTATYTEEHHRAALLNLSHGFALPVSVDEVLNGFGEAD
jgi:isochorismate hydrolase